MGTGEWLRGQTEHCLVAARGKPLFLGGSNTTVLHAARREHSRKPEVFCRLVEAACPEQSLNSLLGRSVQVGNALELVWQFRKA